ncbi:tetraspanin-4-like [Platysternon megacephalum]|uniref:Tetraspanin-4-like n=1 Tax=Platysternon megacephalum TaxID=55544 RepID=A0A4D9DLF8_9SAUR|nr:tetraspanin-4-like [Platysternon megacephalum]
MGTKRSTIHSPKIRSPSPLAHNCEGFSSRLDLNCVRLEISSLSSQFPPFLGSCPFASSLMQKSPHLSPSPSFLAHMCTLPTCSLLRSPAASTFGLHINPSGNLPFGHESDLPTKKKITSLKKKKHL